MARPDTDANLQTLLAPLRNTAFRRIWVATQMSSLGSLMQTVAIGWLMTTISSSDLMVALVQASSTLPVFALSIFAGSVADNFDRRVVMLASLWLMTLASAMMTVLIALGCTDPWLILGFTFLVGCGSAFYNPAWQASVGDIVGTLDLPAAVTLGSAGFNTMRSIGPALGGVIVAVFGPLAAFVFNTLSYLLPLDATRRCRWEIRHSYLPRESMVTSIFDGLRFTAMSAEIKAAIARGALFGVASISILALLPLVVRDRLGAGPVAYGVLMGGFGAGAFLGGISTSVLRRVLSPERLVILACLACAACCVLLATAPALRVATVILAIGGAGWVIAWSGFGVIVQLASPRWIVGRTLSIYYAFTYGGIAAGSWLWGTVAENCSVTIALVSSSGALLLVALAGFLFPVREQRACDQEEPEELCAPAVNVKLQLRRGPIIVRIDYLIPEENIKAFVAVMHERRQIRSRFGARYWTLARDLRQPAKWTESFRTPTWADYLRLHHRLPSEDLELGERVLKLHGGELPPQMKFSVEQPTNARGPLDQSMPIIASRDLVTGASVQPMSNETPPTDITKPDAYD
ncbi:MFS transporter [Paraburkholderia sabiae]|uniref:MFS transporter n=1 Tax=Paraburkholderia sabiae TaxID=273251 RepID=A0ABU9QSH4_9BURK|nr:MFS transporter [Paraburkholderia sabiae]WJZ79558.1 MFS transporter [Paraburkholderia sabiae]CAD6563232.1 Enterobactin exporter EntS [Paraburkholderia sabiae]